MAGAIGYGVTQLPKAFEWMELAIGIPAILLSYGTVIWLKGFTKEDRVLFRFREKKVAASE